MYIYIERERYRYIHVCIYIYVYSLEPPVALGAGAHGGVGAEDAAAGHLRDTINKNCISGLI